MEIIDIITTVAQSGGQFVTTVIVGGMFGAAANAMTTVVVGGQTMFGATANAMNVFVAYTIKALTGRL